MHHPYRKLRYLPLIFLVFLGLMSGHAQAATRAGTQAPISAQSLPVLPQFEAYNKPIKFPDLEFQDAKGAWRKLSDYRGRLILVSLWATWCAPCRREMPALDALQGVYKETAFIILPISMDSAAGAKKIFDFFHDQQIKNLPVLNDSESRALRALRPSGLPSSYLITPDGRAVGEVQGFAHWDTPEAGNLIESYLQK